MTKPSVKVFALITCLGSLPLMAGLMGCADHSYHQSTNNRVDDDRMAKRGCNPSPDPGIEDRRTAGRVREALAAGAAYKYDGVKVMAGNGVVQLSGLVNTRAQRTNAGDLTSKVVRVTSVENNLLVKE